MNAPRLAANLILWAILATVAIILLAGCPATYEAGVRRMAETKLRLCLARSVTPEARANCVAEVRAYCIERKVERGCGEGLTYGGAK